MPFSTANYSPVPHTWVLANRVNQRSPITKVTKIKGNVTQFIGRNSIITSTQCSNWLLHLGIKTPFQVGTLNVMGALFVCFFFFTYSWIFNTGKLPRETSVTLLNTVSRGKKAVYHGKSAPCNPTLCIKFVKYHLWYLCQTSLEIMLLPIHNL